MNIIDCHTHLGRNNHINFSVKDLLNSMDSAKIDKSLVFAGDLNDAPNEWLLQEIAPHRDRLLGVAAVHPLKWKKQSELQDDAARIVDWYGEKKIVAAKFYTGYDHYFINDDRFTHPYPPAEDYLLDFDDAGIPCVLHMGDCLNSVKQAKLKYAHPLLIDDVAVDFPNINFIIAHMAYPWHRDAAEVCYKNANVYADISGFVYGAFSSLDKAKFKKVLDDFTEIVDGNKLLFGTDVPISNQSSYIEALNWCADHTINKKQSEDYLPQTMSKNVLKAFKL